MLRELYSEKLQSRLASRMAGDGLNVWDVAEQALVDTDAVRSALTGRWFLLSPAMKERLSAWLGASTPEQEQRAS